MAASTANRVLAALAVVIAVASAWYVGANRPGVSGWYPPCMFNLATGWHCPGCGGTRAVHHAMNGDVATAFNQNALVILAIPVGVLLLLSAVVYAATGKWYGGVRLPRGVLWGSVAVLVVFAVLRNLPGFGWLAPR